MLCLMRHVTVFGCPKTGYEVDLDDDCQLCKYYVDFDGTLVRCEYDEEAEY